MKAPNVPILAIDTFERRTGEHVTGSGPYDVARPVEGVVVSGISIRVPRPGLGRGFGGWHVYTAWPHTPDCLTRNVASARIEWEEDKPAPAGLSIQLSISSLCRRPCFYRSTEDAMQGEKQTKHRGLIG
jgi:hypothetical protein